MPREWSSTPPAGRDHLGDEQRRKGTDQHHPGRQDHVALGGDAVGPHRGERQEPITGLGQEEEAQHGAGPTMKVCTAICVATSNCFKS